jgi:hypothetical protein
MYFETTVTLPEGSEDSPFHINNFETDVPNTSHTVGNLSKISFTEIKMAATNAPIHAQASRSILFLPSLVLIMLLQFIQAASLSVRTTNSPIEGQFNASDSIRLITTNGLIKAGVGLHNKDDKTPSLVAKTTNR